MEFQLCSVTLEEYTRALTAGASVNALRAENGTYVTR